jgi:hypothetical protein
MAKGREIPVKLTRATAQQELVYAMAFFGGIASGPKGSKMGDAPIEVTAGTAMVVALFCRNLIDATGVPEAHAAEAAEIFLKMWKRHIEARRG